MIDWRGIGGVEDAPEFFESNEIGFCCAIIGRRGSSIFISGCGSLESVNVLASVI